MAAGDRGKVNLRLPPAVGPVLRRGLRSAGPNAPAHDWDGLAGDGGLVDENQRP